MKSSDFSENREIIQILLNRIRKYCITIRIAKGGDATQITSGGILMFYPILIEKVENGFRVTCRDIPECDITKPTLEELQESTENGLMACAELFYRRKKKLIPLPSKPLKNESRVYIPARVQAKILLCNALAEKRIGLSELAEMLDTSVSQAQRLVDFSKSASIENVEKALKILGLSFNITTERTDI